MSTPELPGPGKRRSKAGCLTCRTRRKKCDETHSQDHDGACQRCIQGAWKCDWPQPRQARPVRVFERGPKRARSSGGAGGAHARGDESGANDPGLPAASTSALALPDAVLPSTSSTSFAPGPFTVAPPVHPPFFAPLAPTSIAPLALPSFNLAAFTPFADLSHGLNGVDDFFQTLDLEIAGWEALPSATASAQPSPARSAADTAPVPAPGPGLELDGDEGEKDGWVDPTYLALNDAYLGSLAKPLRDVALESVHKTVVSNELSRNAAMAICLLYRIRAQQHQKCPSDTPRNEGADEQQQAQLRAKADRYFQRALDHVHQETIPLGAKLLALVDLYEHQFISVGASEASFIRLLGELFIQELGRPLLDLASIRNPETLLLAVFGWHDVVRCITSGKRRVLFTLTYLPGEPSPTDPAVLISDVNAFVCEMPVLLGLPVGLMLCAAAIANLSAERDALPDEVVKAKATAIENAIRGWRPPALSAQDLADSAKYLERISTGEMWRHAIIIYLYQSVWRHGPISHVILAAMQQILQIGARVLRQYEPSPSMKPAAARSEVDSAPSPTRAYLQAPLPTTATSTSFAESLSASDVPGSSISSRTMSTLFSPLARAIPFFLAGTCALLPSERALCLEGLRACGPLKGYLDDIRALERVWELQNESGWLRDWREVLEEEKMAVAFM